MLKAGDLNKQITIERKVEAVDDWGTETDGGWAVLDEIWAQIRYGAGAERRQAAQEGASQAATFIVRQTSISASVGTRDRLIADGAAWDIQGVALPDRERVEITAVRAA